MAFGKGDWEEKNKEKTVDFKGMAEVSEEISNSIRNHVLDYYKNMVFIIPNLNFLCHGNLVTLGLKVVD